MNSRLDAMLLEGTILVGRNKPARIPTHVQNNSSK